MPTMKPLHGLLCCVGEELSEAPLYYKLTDLCKFLHCNSPPFETLRAAFVNSGYRISSQHKEPQAIKTDAPNRFVWDVLRSWVKDNPVSKKHLKEGSAVQKILSVEPKYNIDFSIPKDMHKRKKAQRYPMNPEKNWGPKARAVGKRKLLSQGEGAPASKIDKP